MKDIRFMISKPIGLGTASLQPYLDVRQSRQVLYAALDAGITYFDTSPRYRFSENFLGKYLPERSDMIIATKVGLDPLRTSAASLIRDQVKTRIKAHLKRRSQRPEAPKEEMVNPSITYDFGSFQNSVERSLRILRREALDVLHVHEPENIINLEELLDWINVKIQSGLVRYRGLAIHRSGNNLLQTSFDDDIIWQFPWAHKDLFANKCRSPIIFGAGKFLHGDGEPVRNLEAIIQETNPAIVLTQTCDCRHLKWVRNL